MSTLVLMSVRKRVELSKTEQNPGMLGGERIVT